VSWDEFAVRGAIGLAVFVVLFALARMRWNGRNKNGPPDEQGNNSGLD
jgi:hypothetical protein